MGQQTSTADRPPVHARRDAPNALAAVAVMLGNQQPPKFAGRH